MWGRGREGGGVIYTLTVIEERGGKRGEDGQLWCYECWCEDKESSLIYSIPLLTYSVKFANWTAACVQLYLRTTLPFCRTSPASTHIVYIYLDFKEGISAVNN